MNPLIPWELKGSVWKKGTKGQLLAALEEEMAYSIPINVQCLTLTLLCPISFTGLNEE